MDIPSKYSQEYISDFSAQNKLKNASQISNSSSSRHPDCFTRIQQQITCAGNSPLPIRFDNGSTIGQKLVIKRLDSGETSNLSKETSSFNTSNSFTTSNPSDSSNLASSTIVFDEKSPKCTRFDNLCAKDSTTSTPNPSSKYVARDWRIIGPSQNNSKNFSSNHIQQENQGSRQNVVKRFNKNSYQIPFESCANFLNRTVLETSTSSNETNGHDSSDILKMVMDMQVKVHKTNAKNSEAKVAHVWHGKCEDFSSINKLLFENSAKNRPFRFSKKAFAGGVPWEATEKNIIDAVSLDSESLMKKAKQTDPKLCEKLIRTNIVIEYPTRQVSSGISNQNSILSSHKQKSKPSKSSQNYFPGYVYLLFESSEYIQWITEEKCYRDENNPHSKLYFDINVGQNKPNGQIQNRRVEFIPFDTQDSEWINPKYAHSNSTSAGGPSSTQKSAFVGALHGQMPAKMLAAIMSDLFGEVTSVFLDLDKWDYPIGSARVTFLSDKSLYSALDAGLVDVHTDRFYKRIQIDPYLKVSSCHSCHSTTTPTYFCRDSKCYAYFCKDCWFWRHNAPSGDLACDQNLKNHVPLTR